MARQSGTSEENQNQTMGNHSPASRSIIYTLGAALILVLVFVAGLAAGRNHNLHRTPLFSQGFMERGDFDNGMRHMRGGLGDNVTINGQTRVSGVVTSVDGSNLTIAGHGGTTNVTTNGSTQYSGGNQVKQNDTVMVVGTTSNNNLTATKVVINP